MKTITALALALALSTSASAKVVPFDPPKELYLEDDVIACMDKDDFMEMAQAFLNDQTMLFQSLYELHTENQSCIDFKGGQTVEVHAEEDTPQGKLTCLNKPDGFGCYWTNL